MTILSPRNLALTLLTLCAAACATDYGGEPSCDDGLCDGIGVTKHCTAAVRGKGNVDIETVYLPQVLACENPKGSLQSLKAQAVASRSYLYYKLGKSSSIGDGESAQVYSCNNPPSALHKQAVAETSGQVLRYNNVQVAAFYVQGAQPNAQTCQGVGTDANDTEKHVTYNQGLRGSSVKQSSQGWKSARNHANRGSMSQLGANCLAKFGTYDQILQFYYGADIQLVTASGACSAAPSAGSSAWIGTECKSNSAVCNFQAGQGLASCMRWNASPGQPAYCSVGCSGVCPSAVGQPQAFCANLGGAHGFCTKTAAGGCPTGTYGRSVQQYGNPYVAQTVCLP